MDVIVSRRDSLVSQTTQVADGLKRPAQVDSSTNGNNKMDSTVYYS